MQLAVSISGTGAPTFPAKKEFICDTAADIQDLPTECAPSSTALVIETGAILILNSAKEWKEV